MANALLRLLPLAFFIFLPATFVISYVLSVTLNHVYPLLPNISDTGTLPPESCFFSMMLNISAVLLAFAVYVRHKEVEEYFRLKNHVPSSSKVSCASTVMGFISCVGLDLAANFQHYNVRIVHDIGILLYFWGGTVYIILQTVISFWMSPIMNSMMVVIFRSILSILAFLFVIANQTSREISRTLFKGNATEIMKWDPNDPGWDWHVTSSVSEWILTFVLAIFILTFHKDFHKVTLLPPEIIMTEDIELTDQPVQVRGYRSYSFLYT